MAASNSHRGIALLADAHIGGPGGSAGPLVEQLDGLPAEGAQRLVVMGDLFQVWVADRRYETEDVREVVAAIDRLRAAGVVVDYIEGNRDFFVAAGDYSDGFDSVGTETSFEAGGLRYLVVHGDGLNDSDRQYLFWRWLSKSLPVRWFMLHLPRGLARWLTDRTERRAGGHELQAQAAHSRGGDLRLRREAPGGGLRSASSRPLP